jgi:hypothetical protein
MFLGNFPADILVLNAVCNFVCVKNLVMNFLAFPPHVNFKYFVISFFQGFSLDLLLGSLF